MQENKESEQKKTEAAVEAVCFSEERIKPSWRQQGDSFISLNPSHPLTHPDLARGGQPAGTRSFNASAPNKLRLPSVQTAGKGI